MKIGHELDEIVYTSTDGTVAKYEVRLEGRPVMQIFCDEAAGPDNRRIWIAKPDGSAAQPTKGVYAMQADLAEDSDGTPLSVAQRVNERSVYAYVLPRLHLLIARLYVPLA